MPASSSKSSKKEKKQVVEEYSEGSESYSTDSESTTDGESGSYEEKKLTLSQACGLNTMNMFGTGPFITIPFVVAAADPPGPHALIGYAMAAFACMNDSLVWSELGSIWPDSGGSYVYLRELYGPHRWGRLCAFIFVWQIMVSGPMECASGFIATAQYIAYIDKEYSYFHHSGIAFVMCVLTVWALYREIDEVGTITLILWALTIGAIIFTIIAGYITFRPKYIASPPDAFDDGGAFFVSMAIAARFAVYDFTGYYDVNFVGKEVQNPRRTIPVACIMTCCVVAMCFFLVDVAVIGSLEWDPDKDGYVKLVTSGAESANFIMALFCETHISREFAIFFTCIVVVTIFGSCFSFMIGLAQIPYTAAKDGYFYAFLAHEHERHKGLQDYSLLFVGTLSTIFCFVELELVIEGMLTMQLLVQFMGQGWGLIWYRYFTPVENQEEAPFSVPGFPIPNIIQLTVFMFIFLTTDNYVIQGHVPLFEIALLFLFGGAAMYLMWARTKSFWPFDKNFDDYEDELEHRLVYFDDMEEEMDVLKKRLFNVDKKIKKWKKKNGYTSENTDETDEKIRNHIFELGKQEFEIISLSRKIMDVEVKLSDLHVHMSDQEKLLTETKIQNNDLNERINSIQRKHGDMRDRSPRGYHDDFESGPKYSSMHDNTDTKAQSVLEWTVEDVYLWWRVALPRGAQRYIELVKECQLTGVDLLGVDEEMLSQFGMMKVLIHQVLKQIQQLKKIVVAQQNYDPNEAMSMPNPRSKSKDRKADPGHSEQTQGGYGYDQSSQRLHPNYDDPYESSYPRRGQSKNGHSPNRRSRDPDRDRASRR